MERKTKSPALKGFDALMDFICPDVKIHGDCGVTILDKSVPPGGGVTIGSMDHDINLIAGQAIGLQARQDVEIVGTGDCYKSKLGKIKKIFHTAKTLELWNVSQAKDVKLKEFFGPPEGEHAGGVTLRQNKENFVTINDSVFEVEGKSGTISMREALLFNGATRAALVSEKGPMLLLANKKIKMVAETEDITFEAREGSMNLSAKESIEHEVGPWKVRAVDKAGIEVGQFSGTDIKCGVIIKDGGEIHVKNEHAEVKICGGAVDINGEFVSINGNLESAG